MSLLRLRFEHIYRCEPNIKNVDDLKEGKIYCKALTSGDFFTLSSVKVEIAL